MLRKYPLSILAIMLIVISALIAGCGAKGLKLNEAGNDGQVTIGVGEKLVIALESNPSTGYTWEISELDTTSLEQVGDIEFVSANPGLLGAGGMQTLTLIARQPGQTTVKLVYHRPWEKDVQPLKTYTVTLTIQ